ncbi:hypothetical protein PIB30_028557 [Stylosanthes scabra]|uniref:Uncharacterized protein n=1 Tax=Stylosanthes scabra TaxID=79078 RepID=A0ABU6TAQ4_9FABA|nr:hypothetical protein [Stylosanthes scabra]
MQLRFTPKARGNTQAPVEKPPIDIKGKKTARISVKPLRKRFSQRLIARGGPSRPKPKKAVVIDFVSDEEGEAQEKEAAIEQPPLIANQEEPKDEEEDPNYEEEAEEEDLEESLEPKEAPLSCGALMWLEESQLLPRIGILLKRKRRTVPPRPPP